MLIVMSKEATSEQIDAVVAAIQKKGYTARPIPGGERVAIGILHNKGAVEASYFLEMPGVKDTIPVTRPYKLVSRAAVAVGAHGVLVEVRHAPEDALSDGTQSLYPEQFDILCRQIEPSPWQATGNLHRKVVVFLTIRSLTPQQATGNALAYSVQSVRSAFYASHSQFR